MTTQPSTAPQPQPPPRRGTRPTPHDVASAPVVPWATFLPLFLREFEQGHHVTILGPTQSGKTTLALEVLEAREHILFLATKREDPLIAGLAARGYRISHKLDIRARDGKIIDKRFVFWPVQTQLEGQRRHMTMAEFRQYQKAAIRHALNYVWRVRRWAVFADETLWLSDAKDGLGLAGELNTLWYQGATAKISLIAASQRPSWIPRAAYSSPEHLFFFSTTDKADLDRLADIGAGIDKQVLGSEIVSLKRHEFVYLAPRQRPPVLIKSRVELAAARRPIAAGSPGEPKRPG